ncbi:Rhamnogalacturonan I rhamnosyltransferase 1 [Sesamum angolense]|uniref:Rhamnogalacturonan I rhamnosyltransferase 1 n=1 Tax=Sesamum angolense TaxID=2727404 RepID=A0AAE1WV53_9LAMI|nr:Rhamnogalacturonan I rhamnosyltransferase 1 [Sesamum angolense]
MKKEMLLGPEDLRQFQNLSSQMAALYFIVSVASNVFVAPYDGSKGRGRPPYLGYKKTFQLDRRWLIELLDLHHNGTLSLD